MNELEFTEQDFQDLIDIIIDCENDIAEESSWIREETHKSCAYDKIITEIEAVWNNLPAEIQNRYKL